MKKIFLIGMMGSGKSSVGIKLAELLKLPLYDTDQIVGVPNTLNNKNI